MNENGGGGREEEDRKRERENGNWERGWEREKPHPPKKDNRLRGYRCLLKLLSFRVSSVVLLRRPLLFLVLCPFLVSQSVFTSEGMTPAQSTPKRTTLKPQLWSRAASASESTLWSVVVPTAAGRYGVTYNRSSWTVGHKTNGIIGADVCVDTLQVVDLFDCINPVKNHRSSRVIDDLLGREVNLKS
jgi:hypothetical protein